MHPVRNRRFGPAAPPRVALALSLLAAMALGFAASTAAQEVEPVEPRIRYTVHLDAPQTQTFSVTMEIESPGNRLEVHLPVWRPGRYVVLDPAGTVRRVAAFDQHDEPLPIRKTDKSGWSLEPGASDRVEIRYEVYANSLGDRTRHVDATHAFLSPSSVFLYVAQLRHEPLTVRLEAPADWQVASGLDPAGDDERTLFAADYDVLVDSPIEIGLQDRIRFEVLGKRHDFVIWPPGARYDRERLVRDVTAIVEEQHAIFGRLPYARYVFLLHAGAGAGGGTEHLNSTIMQTSLAALEGSVRRTKEYRRLLGLVSHEFFHTWNVKQLRPAGITPYDYQHENYSPLFWLAEGGTSYYGSLTLARAELITAKQYLKSLGESIDAFRRRPGARVQSLAESSFDAWIKFNRRSPDDRNATVSFYRKGSLVSLLLDLELRRRTAGAVDLDAVMREMFERYPLEDGGYTEENLRETLEQLAGSSFADFFARYVRGTDRLPLEDALLGVGVELYLEPEKDDGDGVDEEQDETAATVETDAESVELRHRADLGLELEDRGGRSIVTAVLADGPAWLAGVEPGDELVALDGIRPSADGLTRRLDVYEPGETVRLHLLRHDRLVELDVTLLARPAASWSLRRVENPSAAQRAAWEQWIHRPWPEDAPAHDTEG